MSALVIGEALVDVVTRGDVSVSQPGGSPMNVAVGLSRLGISTVLHSQVGFDDNGELIARLLARNNVPLTEGSRRAGPTSVAHATIGADGAARYQFSIEWDPADISAVPLDAFLIHTGSIAAVLEPGATLVERLLTQARAVSTVSFDPNVRPQLMGSPEAALAKVERLVGLADIVKASDEDLRWLYPGDSIESVLERWLDLGPALVVATRGEHGADAVARSGRIHLPSRKATVVDTIGAGDSFMAGLLAALGDEHLLGPQRREALRSIDDATVARAVEFAARCAAITVSRAGANPPTRAEVASS